MLHILLLGSMACPFGDAPRAIASFEEVDADLLLRVDDDGIGRLRMRLAFENTGDGPAIAIVTLATPDERPPVITRAALVGEKDATLSDTSIARERWDAFVDALQQGVAAEEVMHGARRAGIHLSTTDDHDGTPRLEVAAACSVRKTVVEIDMLFDGEATRAGWRFALPAPFVRTSLSVKAGARDVVIDGRRTRTHAHTELDALTFDDDDGRRPFIVHVERPRPISARGTVITLEPRAPTPSPTRETEPSTSSEESAPDAPFALAHLAMDLPDPLAETPGELHVVFVVDTSVSVGEAGVERTLDLVHAILDASPDDVRFALVTSSRRPALHVPPWRKKSERHVPTPVVENGSNLSLAVAMAERIAADAPAGSGRVIVLSDLAHKSGDGPRLSGAIGAAQKRRHATSTGQAPLVHVVKLPRGLDEDVLGLAYARAPDHDEEGLARAVFSTGGILLTTSSDADDDTALAHHLTVPTSLDEITIRFDGVRVEESESLRALHIRSTDDATGSDDLVPDTLGAGQGLRAAFILDARVRALTVSGRLWGTRVEIPIASSSRARVLALAHVANIELGDELHDDEVRAAAFAGHFASRTTSFLDVPSWRAEEPEMLSLSGCGCRGWGSCGAGHSSFSTRCGGLGPVTVSKARDILATHAARIAEVCDVANIDATVEVRDHEILDVTVRNGNACVVEAWWKLRLDRSTRDGLLDAHRTWTVRIPALVDEETSRATQGLVDPNDCVHDDNHPAFVTPTQTP
jgi:hypothetical protein